MTAIVWSAGMAVGGDGAAGQSAPPEPTGEDRLLGSGQVHDRAGGGSRSRRARRGQGGRVATRWDEQTRSAMAGSGRHARGPGGASSGRRTRRCRIEAGCRRDGRRQGPERPMTRMALLRREGDAEGIRHDEERRWQPRRTRRWLRKRETRWTAEGWRERPRAPSARRAIRVSDQTGRCAVVAATAVAMA